MKNQSLPCASPLQSPFRGLSNTMQQQAAAIGDCANSLCRSLDDMRKAQAHAVDTVAQGHAAIAEKLRDRYTPLDLVALQTELFCFDVESAARYWQQIGLVALGMQACLFGLRNHFAWPDLLLEAASAIDRVTGRDIPSTRA